MADPQDLKIPDEIPILDSYGNWGTIPKDKVADAVQNGGFSLPTHQQLKEQSLKSTYGKGFQNAAISLLESGLSSATFGSSRELENKLGITTPEAQEARRKYNPLASAAGTAIGIGGMFLAPEAEGLGAIGKILNPVKTVAEAGGALTEAVLPAAEGIGGKVLGGAAATGLGAAAEGSLYGLGSLVDEHALGNTDLTAEKALSSMGMGALLGGGVGAVFGGIGGAYRGIKPHFVSELDKAGAASGDFASSLSASGVSGEEKESILAGLSKLKEDASEIQAAGSRIGAPVLESQISASPLVQKADSLLLNGPPTFSSIKRQKLLEEGFQKANNAVESTLGEGQTLSKAELGEQFQASLKDKILKESEPISELYNEIKQYHEAIPLADRSIPAIMRNIKNLDDVSLSPSSPQGRIANRVVKELPNLNTVDDVKRYRSILNQSLAPTASSGEKRIVSIIGDKLKDLEDSSVVRFAEEKMLTTKAKDKILNLLDQRKVANEQYKGLMSKVGDLMKVLGKKRTYGPGDAIDYLENKLTPEKVTERLFAKNNSQFMKSFQENFPEETKALVQYQKNLIRDKALKSGEFKAMPVINEIDKLQPELKSILFSPEELQKMADAKKWIQSVPENINPSKTAHATAFREFFEHPVGSAIANVRDYGLEKFIKGVAGQDAQYGAHVEGIAKLENLAMKTAKKIIIGANRIIDVAPHAAIPLAISTGKTMEEKKEEHKKLTTMITTYNNDPEKLIDRLHQVTDNVAQFAPNVAGGLQMTAAKAVQFLGTKIPVQEDPMPLSEPMPPSDYDVSKFERYIETIDNPLTVMNHVKNNTLTAENMEALGAVYPNLYKEMKIALIQKIGDYKAKKNPNPLPYQTKMTLSLFLGQDMNHSLSQPQIAANQMSFVSAEIRKQQEVAKASGGRQKNGGKLNVSDRMENELEKNQDRA